MNKLFLLTTLLLLSSQSFGESVSKKTDKYALVSANSALETLLEIPEVKTTYDECVKEKSDNMADCVWAKVSKKPDLKKQVLDKYNKLSIKEDKNTTRNPASEEKTEEKQSSLSAKKFNLATNYADDPQVQALTAFYKKKLDEVLSPSKTPEINGKKSIAAVDHVMFTTLYESELGNTIINAFTSYCLETNLDCGKEVYDEKTNETVIGSCELPEKEEDRTSNRKANLTYLKSSSTSFSDEKEKNKWTYCLTKVTDICTESSSKYSQKRACLIVDYVKSARESLAAVQGQKEFWKENAKKGTISASSNFHVIDESTDKKANANYLTTITAKDIADVSKKVDEEKTALMDKCLIGDEKDPQLGDREACKSFINTNKEESEKALVEFSLRQSAQEELLTEKLNSTEDKDSVKKYLLDEGYSEAEATALLAEGDPEELKKLINQRFKNEKAALIQEMKDRVTKQTTQEEGQITDKDISTLSKIKNELKSRTEDLVQSVQFNNIVSSYLDFTAYNSQGQVIKGGGGRNIASLFAEVESMENDENTKELAKSLQEKIDKAQLKAPKTSITLGLENLNKNFLKYFSFQSEKKEKKDK